VVVVVVEVVQVVVVEVAAAAVAVVVVVDDDDDDNVLIELVVEVAKESAIPNTNTRFLISTSTTSLTLIKQPNLKSCKSYKNYILLI
jgi:hypothetical protein